MLTLFWRKHLSDGEKGTRNSIVFLFGAGASVDAGVPTTFSFVADFNMYVKESHPESFELLSKILTLREEYNVKVLGQEKKAVDVEQLLDTLRRLIVREKEPLIYFYKKAELRVKFRQNEVVFLEKLLQNFIRKRVIVEKQEKLGYLQELFRFDKPLVIFSTNYDTCIEQTCYLNHRSYTDGFDITWNEHNFEDSHDVLHYKLHGSVIWYQNERTKECVKIPVSAFTELFEDPIDLKLIYGEQVKPLLIYPAQKAEYVEPLTDLQLMFKKTLFQRTKFLVVVGYSFRDDYIAHMLWDASRVNEDLHIIIVDPNSQEHFDKKIKYIDEEIKALSRLSEKVLCLPYPFSTAIYQLKNNYLYALQNIISTETRFLEQEKTGYPSDWQTLFRMCLEGEYIAKAECILEKKIRKDFKEVQFNNASERLTLSFRSLLYSVICGNGLEERWLERVNGTLESFDINNLLVFNTATEWAKFGFFDKNKALFEFGTILADWINPLVTETKRKEDLLTEKFLFKLNRLQISLNKFKEFASFLQALEKGVNVLNYSIKENDSDEVKLLIASIDDSKKDKRVNYGSMQEWALGIEKGRLKNFLNATIFQFELEPK
jgi:hypothetical protein